MPRIDNLDSLLTSDDNGNSIIELDVFIIEGCSYGENLENLTQPQKDFFFNQTLEREINNGGFNQYFYNSSGTFAHQTVESLKAIGATATATVLQRAINEFPDSSVPEDESKRWKVLEEIQEAADLVWERLDNEFLEYREDLTTLNLNYVKRHKADF